MHAAPRKATLQHASGRSAFCRRHDHASVLVNRRIYDARVCGSRFLQVDPVEGGSANDYEYCNADPINCFDLDGRESTYGDTNIRSWWNVQYAAFQVPLRYGKNTGKNTYGYNYIRRKHGWHPTLMRLALTRGVIKEDRPGVFRYTYYYGVKKGRCVCALGLNKRTRKYFTVIVDYNRLPGMSGGTIGIRNAWGGSEVDYSIR